MDIVFRDIAIVISMAGFLTWLAIVLRQPIIVAYLVTGMLVGPKGLGLVHDVAFLQGASHIGVALLLFLAGLVLHPHRLLQLLRQTSVVTIISSALFFVVAAVVALLCHGGVRDSLFVGLALMFSSTILVIKLLPTITLHHKHMGSVCIAVLIAQDLIAVGVLMLMSLPAGETLRHLVLLPFKGGVLLAGALLFEQFVLRRIMRQCDRFHEALYLIALGWCFAVVLASAAMGFTIEVGAFIAGIALARSPIALFLSEGLKFFRDFFLVLFFFVLGAEFDIAVAAQVTLPALVLAGVLVVFKPAVFFFLFGLTNEDRAFARETAFRLGQSSEFSLIIAFAGSEMMLISDTASKLIQLTTIFTMVASSYIVVFFYPTPLGTRRRLKQD